MTISAYHGCIKCGTVHHTASMEPPAGRVDELGHWHCQFCVNVAIIQKRVAVVFNIPLNGMLSKSRARRLSEPRHAAMYLAWKLHGEGPSVIGRTFNCDHTTVHYALKHVPVLCEQNPTFKRKLKLVEDSLHDPRNNDSLPTKSSVL